MKKSHAIITLVFLVGILSGLFYLSKKENTGPGPLDDFAKCIKDKGAKFYGAFWCPHCASEKKLFGPSKQYLPYVECSTPDAEGQLDECTKAGIEGYPTWIFADGSKLSGEVSLQDLASKTSCTLPANNK